MEWPSIEQFIEINKDKRMLPLLEVRNHYLDFIKEGCFYKVVEDADLEIPENKTISLLLSSRTILDHRNIRFQWMQDARNSALSPNLYFSGNLTKQYGEEKDIEEFTILMR